MSFTIVVCAEMVYTDLDVLERVRRIDAAGFDVEIWDWTSKDLDVLAATGARIVSMTGYTSGRLTDLEGAEALLATAEQSIAAAASSAFHASTFTAPDSEKRASRSIP